MSTFGGRNTDDGAKYADIWDLVNGYDDIVAGTHPAVVGDTVYTEPRAGRTIYDLSKAQTKEASG